MCHKSTRSAESELFNIFKNP